MGVNMKGYISILTFFLLACFAACSSTGPNPGESAPEFQPEIGPLPALPHMASESRIFDGVEYMAAGPGLTDNPPTVELNAEGIHCSWALYAYGLPGTLTLDMLSIDVESVSDQFWVALPDYGTGHWEFHGPYTDDCLLPLAVDPEKYLSPEDNFYWVVIAENRHSLSVVGSTVATTGFTTPVYYVPPPGVQEVFAGPATDPYVIIMDDTVGSAEDGAPIVLYTADYEGEPNTYLAWYNGSAWESRVLDPMNRYTFGRGYWAGEYGMLYAYYHGAGGYPDYSAVTEFYMDATWNISGRSIRGSYDKVPDVLEFTRNETTGMMAIMTGSNEGTGWVNVNYDFPTSGGGSLGITSLGMAELADMTITFADEGLNGWMMYTVGQTDADQKLHHIYVVKYHEFVDGSWIQVPANYFYHDKPLLIDLHYTTAGEPELLAVCARDLQLTIPPDLDTPTTLFQDVCLATYTGSEWEFADLFTGTIDESNKESGELVLDIGVDISWAGADSLIYSNGAGTVTFTQDPEYAITGGTLTAQSTYLSRSEGTFGASAYYTGGSGVNFNWAEGPGGPVCVYIDNTEVPIEVLTAIEVRNLEGGVMYWGPAPVATD